jgi:UDP-GlcNAc:undecaprenyl-phosphate GlcNAc-1-phosphate transferase
MLIGFVLGALAILCSFKQNYTYAFFAPIALLAIPFIDTAAAIIRRRLTGRSIFAVDRGHLHHSLMKRGYSPTISLLWVFLLCSTTAAGGVLSLINHESNYAMVSIVIVVFVMVGCKIFGVAEFQLVSRKAGSLAKSVFHLTSKTKPDVALSSVHVQGSRDWHEEWTMLCEFADRHGIIEVTLDVNAPWMHESFHATRKRANVPRGGNHEWYSEIPLVAAGRVFGRVEIVDNADNERPHHLIIKEALTVISEIEVLLVKPDFNLVHVSGEPPDDPADSQRPVPSLAQQKFPKDTESPGKTASTSPGSMGPEKWGAKNG